MNSNEETWYNVKGFKGILKITKSGRVKRVADLVKDKNGKMKIIKEYEFEPKINTRKERVINLEYKGENYNLLIHELLAKTFIKNPNPIYYRKIFFKDYDRGNISLDNMCWVPNDFESAVMKMKMDKDLAERQNREFNLF